MARPSCPACSDNYTVAKVSALYQTVSDDSSRASIGRLDPEEILEWFAPPTAPGPIGRYLAMAIITGLAVCVLSGFAFMWLYIALSIGVVTEMMTYWEHLQARDDYQRALARWRAAYCCSTHGVVFFGGERRVYPPSQLADLIRGAAAEPPTPAPAEGHPVRGVLSAR